MPKPTDTDPSAALTPPDDLTRQDAQAFVAQNPPAVSAGPPPDPVTRAVTQAQSVRAVSVKSRPVWLYVAVAAVLGLIVIFSLIGSSRPKSTGSTSGSSAGPLSVPTPGNQATSGLSNQARQDLKTCSNVVNAALEC